MLGFSITSKAILLNATLTYWGPEPKRSQFCMCAFFVCISSNVNVTLPWLASRWGSFLTVHLPVSKHRSRKWLSAHETTNNLLNKSWLSFRTQHDDVIKWKHFSRHWPFVRGIHRSPVNSPRKRQSLGALMSLLICAGIHGWVNSGEAGDLTRHCAHYDVIVMNVRDETMLLIYKYITLFGILITGICYTCKFLLRRSSTGNFMDVIYTIFCGVLLMFSTFIVTYFLNSSTSWSFECTDKNLDTCGRQ